MTEVSKELISAAANGDEEAFCEIVDAFQVPVYNLCFRYLYNEGIAEEAAQEIFWKAWSNLKSYDSARPFRTWLLSIAAHHCTDIRRKKQVQQVEIDETMEEILPEKTDQPLETVIKSEREEKVRQMLTQLSDLDCAAVILRYWYDFSDQEIGKALGLTESAVKSRLFRARREMANLWSEE